MNKEAIRAVADVIEWADRLDMRHVITPASFNTTPKQLWEDCGSAGCVGGWTAAWADDDSADWATIMREFNITVAQALSIFTGQLPGLSIDEKDAKVAAQCLRDLANGKYWWDTQTNRWVRRAV